MTSMHMMKWSVGPGKKGNNNRKVKKTIYVPEAALQPGLVSSSSVIWLRPVMAGGAKVSTPTSRFAPGTFCIFSAKQKLRPLGTGNEEKSISL